VLKTPPCEACVDRYLADYAQRNRSNSLHTQTRRLRRFREDFRGRSLDISRAELKQWLHGEGRWSSRGPIPKWEVAAVTTFYNHAIDEGELRLARNPARKLRPQAGVGQPLPTPAEFEALVGACSVLGGYGRMMRAALLFAAYTLLRPGELFALQWSDIDFRRRRIHNHPSGKDRGTRITTLTLAARDAIDRLPRDSECVFTSKGGKPLTAPTFHWHWQKVLAATGLCFRFHHLTKHHGVHYMWTELGLSPRAIAAQAGWTLHNANRILAAYGLDQVGALAEVDAAFGAVGKLPNHQTGTQLRDSD
jgi:integrase